MPLTVAVTLAESAPPGASVSNRSRTCTWVVSTVFDSATLMGALFDAVKFSRNRAIDQLAPPFTVYSTVKAFCPPPPRMPDDVCEIFNVTDTRPPDVVPMPLHRHDLASVLPGPVALAVVEPCPVFVAPVTAMVPPCPASGVWFAVGCRIIKAIFLKRRPKPFYNHHDISLCNGSASGLQVRPQHGAFGKVEVYEVINVHGIDGV